jgi:hypothetical protein
MALYKFTKAVLAVTGSSLVLIGGWYLSGGLDGAERNPAFWFGIFPAYVGVMLILISLAVKIEWFTDTRRFW